MRPIITLTTDFGLGSTYPAQMKGVILSISPEARVVDITHEVPPQDVLEGALALESAVPAFPKGTIHVAVVDPGVGSSRLAVAVQTELGYFVGPDNGLFELVLGLAEPKRMVVLDRPAFHRMPVAPTFHGRDIFAPVAAHLAAGKDLDEMGSELNRLTALAVPGASRSGETITGQVLTADRFGNLVTNIRSSDLSGLDATAARIQIGEWTIETISRTYSDAPKGGLVAYLGSSGRLEIALRDGNAQRQLGVGRGQSLVVRRR